ncbi:hypothetical protein GXM_01779 [Nostoc sphaeroides CCNUC1]|uniref:Uncharacterized protein n=1 Tax=Nostoc sphaeroides CCNUC1 TaxID=2653204 RepID=A0A5P8VW00_9NOSO|nr:hypothetical protein GXM_01779 [Nostoc sphaeroides CCNUC1]
MGGDSILVFLKQGNYVGFRTKFAHLLKGELCKAKRNQEVVIPIQDQKENIFRNMAWLTWVVYQ